MSKVNDYVYIVKLSKRYWLFRNIKELKSFLNGDNVDDLKHDIIFYLENEFKNFRKKYLQLSLFDI